MITPQLLIDALANEFRIMKHLWSKVTAENKDFKLTPSQRSTEEVEQYILSSFPVQISLMVAGKRDNEIATNYSKQFENFSYTDFSKELDNALVKISAEILSLQDTQRQERITIRWMEGPRTRFLNDYLLTFLGAYKMQLFLQLKASGLTDLWSLNLWAGIDEPKNG